ncbi:MAG: Transcription elongation factor GreA [Chlamydiia bacterium]|nr:Transcription elongation factor GreA [Chlamydiia bacterium]
MEYFKQFKKHIQDNNLPTTVSLWQEYCLSDEVDPIEMSHVLSAIKEASFSKSFGVYVENGLELWESLAPSQAKDEIIKLIFDIQTTNSAEYSDLAHAYLKERYGEIDIFAELLRIVGLRENEEFQGCIRNFELLIHLQKGNFCLHTGGWGIGEVMDTSFLRREISIEFDLVAGMKEISFKNAFNILVPVPRDHFLARRFGNPEKFEDYTRANPVDSIKLLLKDLGDKTAFEIKEEMADLVIPEEEWTKWWSSVRSKLKKDTEIIYPKSLQEPFKLNTSKVTHEDMLKTSLSEAVTVKDKIDTLYTFLRDFPALHKDPDLNIYLKNEFGEILLTKDLRESEEIQILFLLSDLNDQAAKKNIPELVRKLPDLSFVLDEIAILAFKRRLLSEIKKNRLDWVEIFTDLIVASKKHSLRDFLYEEVMAENKQDIFKSKIESVIKDPQLSPAAFIWFFQRIIKNKTALFTNQADLDMLFEAFFILMHYVEVSLKDRTMTKKMYGMLTDKRFEIVRRIFKGASSDVIKELLLLATKCQILTNHDVKILHSLAEVVHPELSKLRSHAQEETEEEIIWTTPEGMKKVTDRIEQIATKEVIENAKEIEIARAHGDLRENSEYKFAMEKRARLQKEMKSLSAQMKKMKILTKEDVDTSKVSIGTTIELKGENSENQNYTILGPTDADTEKGIISAQSKLAEALLNKIVGEKVNIGDNTWKITKISSIL